MGLEIRGLNELRAALKALPPQLVAEAAAVTEAAADSAALEITGRYPVVTGNLRRGVVVERSHDRVSASSRVRSRARHSHLYERGTTARRWANGKSTGVMPAAHVFVPIVVARRRLMYAQLVEIVERAGFTVTGITA